MTEARPERTQVQSAIVAYLGSPGYDLWIDDTVPGELTNAVMEAIQPTPGDPVGAHDAMVRGVQMSMLCIAHNHREWVPVERHHVWPLGMGGPDTAANKIQVCANAHYSIHAYIDLLITYGEQIPWSTRRHFGRDIRDWAARGWHAAGQPRRSTT